MVDLPVVIIVVVVAATLGIVVGIVLQRQKQSAVKSALELEADQRAKRLIADAQKDSETILKDAELKSQERLLKAEKEVEEQHRQRRRELGRLEERLDKREATLDSRSSKLDNKEAELHTLDSDLRKQRQSLSDREKNAAQKECEALEKLEQLAGLSREEAKTQVVESVTEEAKLEANKTVRQIEEEAINEAEKRAKKILSVAVQRYAGEFATERCVSVVTLPNDDMKGRIIGREGRNIRAIESATGINLIVDDTPEAVVISGFDPVRREIARLSLERLISDGRIHPSRIEEVVEKTKSEVNKVVCDAGERAAFELGLTDCHPEVLRLIGRLKYRTSYGQNMWSHSIEVGFLSGLMAAELGLNVKLARRCGVLHDIGKAIDHEQEGSHAILGANWCKKHGEKEIVVNAVASHHDEMKPSSVFAHLVMAADALSGARPGARREILETYIKRLQDLEQISKSFKGVSNCFAVQAGREIRVMVENQTISDDEAYILSKDIARKIEEELVYPGQIKVIVIRETRAVDYAK